MYSVSDAYKTQIKSQVRNYSYLRVFLGVTDPDALDANTISSTDQHYLSSINDIDELAEIEKRYATFEHNIFILDGASILPPTSIESVDYFQGYVSNSMSDVDCVFATPPMVSVVFSDLFSFRGLTFEFNKALNLFPAEMTVYGYRDESLVFTAHEYPTSWQHEIYAPIPSSGTINKIEIIFSKSNVPFSRAYLESLFFGIFEVFDENNMTSASMKREFDLLSTKLPVYSLDVTAIDVEGLYNPENPVGIWPYIEQRQKAKIEFGYQLEDGSIEWITSGNLYTDGTIKVTSNGRFSNVTLYFKSTLNQLTDLYYKGKYNAASKTLYELAEEVLIYAGVEDYYIDPALQTMYTSLPLPEKPINEVLQIIANAGRCVLYTDRYDVITIKRLAFSLQDFYLTLADVKELPVVDKIPLLYSVDSFYNTAFLESAASELISQDINYPIQTTIRLTHSEATSHYLEDLSGVVVGTPEYYATSTVVTVLGTGTLKIFGNKIIKTKTSVSAVYNEVGYSCPIENPLLNSRQDTIDYIAWVASILLRRNTYSVEDRGFPELDIGDDILVDTLFNNALEATIIETKLQYNGALSGVTKYISRE